VTVWFTLQLDDRPGALARVASALAERRVNITAIVGVAEDTEGALMLATSDAAVTREVLGTLGIEFEDHDAGGPGGPDGFAVTDTGPGGAGRGSPG
jgi:hypothetical protein